MLKYNLTEETNVQIADDKFQGLINDDLREIIQALEDYGFQVRIVGGAVRDILLGVVPRDIDLSTDALPDQIIFILSELEIDADAWGIAHGTVKAIIKKVKYDISSLDYQVHKDANGKIVISGAGSTWEEDAARRDFTANAMSMDLSGKVYDYFNGIKDLENGMVRPVTEFEANIKRTPVVILRFFKMLAKFQGAKYSRKTLQLVKDNLDLVDTISIKRIKQELAGIRKSVNGKNTIKLMKEIGLIDILNAKLRKSSTK